MFVGFFQGLAFFSIIHYNVSVSSKRGVHMTFLDGVNYITFNPLRWIKVFGAMLVHG